MRTIIASIVLLLVAGELCVAKEKNNDLKFIMPVDPKPPAKWLLPMPPIEWKLPKDEKPQPLPCFPDRPILLKDIKGIACYHVPEDKNPKCHMCDRFKPKPKPAPIPPSISKPRPAPLPVGPIYVPKPKPRPIGPYEFEPRTIDPRAA